MGAAEPIPKFEGGTRRFREKERKATKMTGSTKARYTVVR
jgi:hypothetical protein